MTPTQINYLTTSHFRKMRLVILVIAFQFFMGTLALTPGDDPFIYGPIIGVPGFVGPFVTGQEPARIQTAGSCPDALELKIGATVTATKMEEKTKTEKTTCLESNPFINRLSFLKGARPPEPCDVPCDAPFYFPHAFSQSFGVDYRYAVDRFLSYNIGTSTFLINGVPKGIDKALSAHMLEQIDENQAIFSLLGNTMIDYITGFIETFKDNIIRSAYIQDGKSEEIIEKVDYIIEKFEDIFNPAHCFVKGCHKKNRWVVKQIEKNSECNSNDPKTCWGPYGTGDKDIIKSDLSADKVNLDWFRTNNMFPKKSDWTNKNAKNIQKARTAKLLEIIDDEQSGEPIFFPTGHMIGSIGDQYHVNADVKARWDAIQLLLPKLEDVIHDLESAYCNDAGPIWTTKYQNQFGDLKERFANSNFEYVVPKTLKFDFSFELLNADGTSPSRVEHNNMPDGYTEEDSPQKHVAEIYSCAASVHPCDLPETHPKRRAYDDEIKVPCNKDDSLYDQTAHEKAQKSIEKINSFSSKFLNLMGRYTVSTEYSILIKDFTEYVGASLEKTRKIIGPAFDAKDEHDCTGGKEWMKASRCVKTCRYPTPPVKCNNETQMEEKCACPPDKPIWHSGKCIQRGECKIISFEEECTITSFGNQDGDVYKVSGTSIEPSRALYFSQLPIQCNYADQPASLPPGTAQPEKTQSFAEFVAYDVPSGTKGAEVRAMRAADRPPVLCRTKGPPPQVDFDNFGVPSELLNDQCQGLVMNPTYTKTFVPEKFDNADEPLIINRELDGTWDAGTRFAAYVKENGQDEPLPISSRSMAPIKNVQKALTARILKFLDDMKSYDQDMRLIGGFDKTYLLLETIYNYKWLAMESGITPKTAELLSLINQKLDEIFDMQNCFVKGCKSARKHVPHVENPDLFAAAGKVINALGVATDAAPGLGAGPGVLGRESWQKEWTNEAIAGWSRENGRIPDVHLTTKYLEKLSKLSPIVEDLEIRNWKFQRLHNLIFVLAEKLTRRFGQDVEESKVDWYSRKVITLGIAMPFVTPDPVPKLVEVDTYFAVPKSRPTPSDGCLKATEDCGHSPSDEFWLVEKDDGEGLGYEFDRLRRHLDLSREIPTHGLRDYLNVYPRIVQLHWPMRKANLHASWTRAEHLDNNQEIAYYRCNHAYGECLCRYYKRASPSDVKKARVDFCKPFKDSDGKLSEDDCYGDAVWTKGVSDCPPDKPGCGKTVDKCVSCTRCRGREEYPHTHTVECSYFKHHKDECYPDEFKACHECGKCC